MTQAKIKLGIVGVGKIARDQHLPAIAANPAFDLLASASPYSGVDGVANFEAIEPMIDAMPELDAVALCMPTQYRRSAAEYALTRGIHVLLEKPPAATVLEVELLAQLASQNNACLFAAWHSRFGASVAAARNVLASHKIESVILNWKEDVGKWHPDQDWIWQAGSLGVFDSGINGFSVLTEILPETPIIEQSRLTFPTNKAAPIAAQMKASTSSGVPIEIDFDWRHAGDEFWDVEIQTTEGSVRLSQGGEKLWLDGVEQNLDEINEYQGVYRHFAALLTERQSDIDLVPLKLVADAFMLGEHLKTHAFED